MVAGLVRKDAPDKAVLRLAQRGECRHCDGEGRGRRGCAALHLKRLAVNAGDSVLQQRTMFTGLWPSSCKLCGCADPAAMSSPAPGSQDMVAYEQRAGLRPKHDAAPDKERRQQVLLTAQHMFSHPSGVIKPLASATQWMLLLLAHTELSWRMFPRGC